MWAATVPPSGQPRRSTPTCTVWVGPLCLLQYSSYVPSCSINACSPICLLPHKVIHRSAPSTAAAGLGSNLLAGERARQVESPVRCARVLAKTFRGSSCRSRYIYIIPPASSVSRENLYPISTQQKLLQPTVFTR